MEDLGERIGCRDLYVKRDDLSGAEYGGNKVRKLEFTLADVERLGRDTVITFGALGSNHVLATTLYGRKHGIRTVGVFVPQPVQEYLRTNVLCNHALGCRIEYVQGRLSLASRIARLYMARWMRSSRPYFLWMGGSTTLGVLGYVNAALELASQVDEGLLPEPDLVFVPAGTGGTMAGLLLGLKLAGLRTTPVGVRVLDRDLVNEGSVAAMAWRSLRYLRRRDPALPEVAIRAEDVVMIHDQFGGGYARFTPDCTSAIRTARDLEGLRLEGTYSGKAMAGMMDFMRTLGATHSVAVFVNTHNSVDLGPLASRCAGPHVLPEAVQGYFSGPVDADL
jgi:D-cysteine desulfhydrase